MVDTILMVQGENMLSDIYVLHAVNTLHSCETGLGNRHVVTQSRGDYPPYEGLSRSQ
jgi:hypothetical protein